VKVCRLRQRFDDFKSSAVLQGWDARTRIDDFCGIDLTHDDPRLGATFGNDAPPRVNDQ
jgi:hypothetical protein